MQTNAQKTKNDLFHCQYCCYYYYNYYLDTCSEQPDTRWVSGAFGSEAPDYLHGTANVQCGTHGKCISTLDESNKFSQNLLYKHYYEHEQIWNSKMNAINMWQCWTSGLLMKCVCWDGIIVIDVESCTQRRSAGDRTKPKYCSWSSWQQIDQSVDKVRARSEHSRN